METKKRKYTPVSEKWQKIEKQRKEIQELGILCIQNGITKVDIFQLIQNKRALEDKEWTD